MPKTIFHHAFPVHDFDIAVEYYVNKLGFSLGRRHDSAMVLNFGGHQIVAHKVDNKLERPKFIYPRHFGLIFSDKQSFDNLLKIAKAANIELFAESKIRHEGKITAHNTFFLLDPSNNLLEFKFYHHADAIFGATESSDVGEAQ